MLCILLRGVIKMLDCVRNVEAREFAVKFHGSQQYGNKPYSFHLDGVMKEAEDFISYIVSIRDFDYDEDTIGPAIYLHDILEDTNCMFEDIENEFGYKVAKTVLTLTHSNHETYGEYIVRVSKDPNAILIKIADLFFNKEQSIKSLETTTGKDKKIIEHRLGKYELALLYLSREIWAT